MLKLTLIVFASPAFVTDFYGANGQDNSDDEEEDAADDAGDDGSVFEILRQIVLEFFTERYSLTTMTQHSK